jgi:hypothetical protein
LLLLLSKSEWFPNPKTHFSLETGGRWKLQHTEVPYRNYICVFCLCASLSYIAMENCRLQIECPGNASGDGSELGILQRWREKITALRARFPTGSGFLSHKDLSKRNCCVKWNSSK